MSENLADYRLAHAEFVNNTPRDYISYDWIRACATESRLVDTMPFLIRSLRVVNAAPSRRNMFTPDQDNLLISLARQGKLGAGKQAGNEAFKKLAREHPEHTFESWRQRWVKHLQPQIGRQIEKERKERQDKERRERLKRGEDWEAEDDERIGAGAGPAGTSAGNADRAAALGDAEDEAASPK